MYIRIIHIENFRNLVDVKIHPNPDAGPIVLIGENNCGKSNLIFALRLLLDPNAQRLHLDLSEFDINDNARQNGQKQFSITVEIGGIEQHDELRAIFHQRIDRDGDKEFVTLQLTYIWEPDNDTPVTFTVQPPSDRASDPEPMTPAMRRALPLYYLDATRDAQRDTRATGRSLLAEQLAGVDIADVSDDVSASLHEANEKLAEGTEVRELSEGLTRELTPPLPGVNTELVLSVTDEEPNHILRNMRLRIRAGLSAEVADLERFGTGLHNLVVISIFRNMVSQSTTAFPILAIEEPEAHLHPHAQRRLFRDISRINAPVVISSHSPSLVASVNPYSLAILRVGRDNEVTAYQITSSLNPLENKHLKNLLSFGESVFARVLLLVEGPTEEIVVPAFATALDCDLDRYGVTILNASGKNSIAPLLKVCSSKDLQIPTTVTYDADVLKSGNDLIKQAKNAGLIDDLTIDKITDPSQPAHVNRRNILDYLGWFAAEDDAEEEHCRAGYLDIYVNALKSDNPYNTYDSYLERNSLNSSYSSIKSYFQSIHRNSDLNGLKIVAAHAVAEEAPIRRKVPPCYANAIRQAVLRSQGELAVDELFEEHICNMGYAPIVRDIVHTRGAMTEYQAFVDTNGLDPSRPDTLARFLKTHDAGQELRDYVKTSVADAIDEARLPEIAKAVRDTPLPTINSTSTDTNA